MTPAGSEHIALRTCIGCGLSGTKGDLLRIARGPAGLVVDPLAQGRGAYVHPAPDCVSASISVRVLARAFRTSVSVDEVGRLERVLASELGVR